MTSEVSVQTQGKAAAPGGRWPAVLAVLVFTATWILITFKWVEIYFGQHLDIEALVFTLRLPLTGADWGLMFVYLKTMALFTPLIGVFTWWCWRHFRRAAARAKAGPAEGPPAAAFWARRPRAAWRLLAALAVGYFGWSIYFLEAEEKLLTYLLQPVGQSELFKEHYRKVSPGEVRFPVRRNLVLLCVESLETTFNDPKIFGEKLLPRLEKMAAGNTSFAGGRHTMGASWTVAGMTAYLLGLPLAFDHYSSMSNYYGAAASGFLPQASSLMSVFEGHGYDISFFLGTSQEFAGQGKLFQTHAKWPYIFSRENVEAQEATGGRRWSRGRWGVLDKELYARAREYLSQRPAERPFFLVLQTIDTHFDEGSDDGLLPNRHGDLRDCLEEADLMAADFVAWIESQPFGPETSIVIVGDHLYPLTHIGPVALPPLAERSPYNLFLNPAPAVGPGRPGRIFGSFDLAPTIIESAGGQLPDGRFGLGVSLFHPEGRTLFESYGIDWYEKELSRKPLL